MLEKTTLKIKEIMENIRVRFAPSPTGALHIGGVRTALYNYLFARQNGGKMILRIEDTDQTRFVPGAESYIIESLKWCGINFDEGVEQGGEYGPYKQSERKEIYQKYADKLIESGNAYYAFDTPEALDALRSENAHFSYTAAVRQNLDNSLNLSKEEVQKKMDAKTPFVIRFKMPEDRIVEMNDLVRGDVKIKATELDDKVLFKSDGMPTYHLANIVDDHLMEISHVIRGEEWLPSLPLHELLYEAFGWEAPRFAHLPLLLKPNGNGKLSKRDGDKLGFPVFPMRWTDPKTGAVSHGFCEDGYLPEAFINMLALLGWNPGTEQEIFTMEELIKSFSIERISKSGARFDPEKAKWFNQQFLRQESDTKLAKEFLPVLEKKGINTNIEFVEKAVALVKERLTFSADLWSQTSFFFVRPENYEPKVVKKRWKETIPPIMSDLAKALEKVEIWQADNIKASIVSFIEARELGMGQVMNALRLTLVGGGSGPDLMTLAEVLGKEEVIARIEQGVSTIKR